MLGIQEVKLAVHIRDRKTQKETIGMQQMLFMTIRSNQLVITGRPAMCMVANPQLLLQTGGPQRHKHWSQPNELFAEEAKAYHLGLQHNAFRHRYKGNE